MTRKPLIPDRETCPYRAQHTPAPEGYIAWHAWAARMRVGHRQVRCRGCRLHVTWKVKGVNEAVTDRIMFMEPCLSCRVSDDGGGD